MSEEKDITWKHKSRPRRSYRPPNARAPRIKEIKINVTESTDGSFTARYAPLGIEVRVEGKKAMYALNLVRQKIIDFINSAVDNNLKLSAE